MSRVFWADALVTFHLAFVGFVLVGLLLILVGAALGWGWVRNFWFRLGHLLSIGFVAAEGVFGIRCPFTVWEAALRGGHERLPYDASAIALFAMDVLYYPVQPHQVVYFHYGYMTFAALVLLALLVAPPRLPWRKAAPKPSPAPPAAPAQVSEIKPLSHSGLSS